jgi:hypothetical protein
MARLRQIPPELSFLSQSITGYKGYTSTKLARRTDQVFSEEVLEKLSETVSMVDRMKRHSGSLNPDLLPSLDIITDDAGMLAKCIADTVPTDDSLLDILENGKAAELMSLDTVILERVGNINQALSMMDLEGGAGITSEDLDSVCELLDDLGNYLRRRAILLTG